jgi:predicted RNase H-like HicB family nuclease
MKMITATLERSKDGYGVWFEEFPNIFSFGKTVEEAKVQAKEAIEFAFEDCKKPPKWLKNGYEIAVKFDVPALLEHYQHIFTKRGLSKITGVNESLLSQYAGGLKRPRKQQVRRIEVGLKSLSKELSQISLV